MKRYRNWNICQGRRRENVQIDIQSTSNYGDGCGLWRGGVGSFRLYLKVSLTNLQIYQLAFPDTQSHKSQNDSNIQFMFQEVQIVSVLNWRRGCTHISIKNIQRTESLPNNVLQIKICFSFLNETLEYFSSVHVLSSSSFWAHSSSHPQLTRRSEYSVTVT